MFSDQQMITAITILVSGYVQLHCGLTVYHWRIVVYLAWFSSLTHLATLTVLRRYFRANPVIRNWRIILMLVVMVLLIVALLPMASGGWGDYPGEPAACYFKVLGSQAMDTSSFSEDTVVSLLVLIASYLARAIKLFDSGSTVARLLLRRVPSDLSKRMLDFIHVISRSLRPGWSKWAVTYLYKACLVIYITAKALCDLIESMFWEVVKQCDKRCVLLLTLLGFMACFCRILGHRNLGHCALLC